MNYPASGTRYPNVANVGVSSAALAAGLADPAAGFVLDSSDAAQQIASVYERAQRETGLLDYVGSSKRSAVFRTRAGADVTTELQEAIDYCRENNVVLRLRGSNCVISDGITLSDSLTPKTVNIIGEGSGYARVGTRGSLSNPVFIDATAVLTKPALRWNVLRESSIENLAIIGPNVAPQGITEPSLSTSAFVTGGVRDSRYSPQCGLGGDALVGSTPPDGGYPGLTYLGGAVGSSAVRLRNVHLRGHVVGWANTVTSGGTQGDSHSFLGGRISETRVAYATGQSQTNAVLFLGVPMDYFHTAFDGLAYGQQQGCPPDPVSCTLGIGTRAFSFGDGFKHAGLYGVNMESLKGFGNFGIGAGTAKLFLTVYHTRFYDRGDWATLPYFFYTSAPALFSGLELVRSGGTPADAWNCGGTGNLTVDNLAAVLNDAFLPMLFQRSDWAQSVGGRGWRCYSTAARSALQELMRSGDCIGTLPSRVQVHPNSLQEKGVGKTYDITLDANANTYVTATGNGTITYNTSTNTISYTNTTNNDYIQVGDPVLWRVNHMAPVTGNELHFAVKCSANDGTNITLSWGTLDDSFVDQTYAPTSTFVALTLWAAGLSLKGDEATGTNTLLNVANASLLRASPPDWIKSASGLALCRVTGISSTTVTVSRNATTTASQVLLFNAKLNTRTVTNVFT